jgi:hypothetical protein
LKISLVKIIFALRWILYIIGTVSSAVGAYLGNNLKTKKLTSITGSVTARSRVLRWYCKNYGTLWGCTVAVAHGARKSLQFIIEKK